MRTFASLLLLLTTLSGNAATYFFSTSQGDDSRTATQAQSSATPWKTIAKFNSTGFAAGDIILFKRGDVFTGTITPVSNGSAASLITVDAYGTGVNPLVSGLSPVTSWTENPAGSGIYQSNVFTPQSNVLMVVLDGKPAMQGRYPNKDAANGGYLTFESFDNTAKTITDNTLSSTAITSAWVGASLAMRASRYYLDRGVITAINTSTGVITYNDANTHSHPGSAGYGYFITNSIKTLDQYGEWYYDPNTGRVNMYFGTKNPDLHDVEVPTTDILLNPKNSYYTFRNIDFQGANKYIVSSTSVLTTLNMKSCNLNYGGIIGLAFANRTNLWVDSCTIRNCGSVGINVGYHNDNPKVTNSLLENIGDIASNLVTDATFQDRYAYGIFSSANLTTGLTAINNQLLNVGYMAIFCDNSNNFIYKNYVNTTNFIMDDGGGIYTGNFSGVAQTNNILRRNVVVNSIGAPAGTTASDFEASGVYLDDNTNNCTADSNITINCGLYGIYTHNAYNSTVRFNTCVDAKLAAIGISDDNVSAVHTTGMLVSRNELFSSSATEKSFYLQYQGNSNSVSSYTEFGVIDSNKICNPFNENGNVFWIDNFSIGAETNNYTWSTWRSVTGWDAHSTQTPIPVTNKNNIMFRYALSDDQTIYLPSTFRRMDGSSLSGSFVLKDHTGVILVR